MSNPISEEALENKIIHESKQLGFEYFTEKEMFELRGSISNVIVEQHLKDFLNNQYQISSETLKKIIAKINSLHDSDLITSNIAFTKILSEGIKIHDDVADKTISYKIIDFDNIKNNKFVITNQFVCTSLHPEYRTQIPDVVIMVNGIPIVVMELKAPGKWGDSLANAFQQMKNYQDFIPKLFTYNVFNVLSNFEETKFGTITSQLSRYQFWRGEDFKGDTYKLFSSLLEPKTLLDAISKYVFFTEEQQPIKIIASYHQYYGVRDLIETSSNATDNKGGIFWHTQGSGKSYSMLFYVKNYAMLSPGTTFVVVTDRTDLDSQLGTTFKKAKKYISQKIHRVDSIKDLSESLSNIKQDGVYFTTIQKFNDTIGELSNRKDIVVITDEAHRSQNNIDLRMELDSSTGEVNEKFGNARYIRDAFPNATFVGFTGTPIEKEDVSTSRIFGEVATRYLMDDAERDRVVVPIKYESRNAKLHLDEEKLKELDMQGAEITKKLISNSDIPSVIKKKVNKIVQSLQNFVSDPDRVRGIAEDFVKHYSERKDLVKGKAMFIALNRHVAVMYYNEIIKADPELEKHIKVIITNSNGQSDTKEMIELAGSSKYRKEMAVEFKKPDSDFKIAIVVDMWLTGFDVPSLDLLYIDKPIKMHNLMQAIARTNRVFTDRNTIKNKEHGLVVDYIGIWSKLNDALAYYSGKTSSKIASKGNISLLKPEYLARLESHYKNYFSDITIKVEQLYEDVHARFDFIKQAHNNIAERRLQHEYISNSAVIKKCYNEIVGSLTKNEKIKFQMVDAIKSHITKVQLAEIDFRDIKKNLIATLNEAIKYDHTVSIDSLDDKPISLSDIISFIKDDSETDMIYSDSDAKLAATRKLVKKVRSINITLSRKMSDTLKKLLLKYDSNHITIEQLREGMAILASEAENVVSNVVTGKYTQKEKALFQILSLPMKDVPNFDRKIIDNIMDELLKIVNDDKQINQQWAYNNVMKKKVRGQLIILLTKYDYPPEFVDSSAKDVVKQIEYQRDFRGR